MYFSERIDDSSYVNIKLLYKLCFNIITSTSDLNKKYNTACFGLKNVGFLAWSEKNEIAAYYGVFPITLTYNARDFLIAQSGDTMTAPNHQKKGLFIRLATETYSLAEQLGVHLIFGFPNNNSYPGFKNKLDWKFTGFMQKYTVRIATVPFCELSSKIRILLPLYHKYVKWRLKKYCVAVDEANTGLFNCSKTGGMIKRDSNFFNYKLAKGDCYLIHINEFFILLKTHDHLFIGDIAKFNDEDGKKLPETLKQLGKMLGSRKVIINLSKNHWLNNVINKSYKPTEGLPIGFKVINNEINPEEIQFTGADFDTF